MRPITVRRLVGLLARAQGVGLRRRRFEEYWGLLDLETPAAPNVGSVAEWLVLAVATGTPEIPLPFLELDSDRDFGCHTPLVLPLWNCFTAALACLRLVDGAREKTPSTCDEGNSNQTPHRSHGVPAYARL